MNKDLNDCKFIGRIGKDIELKYSAGGKAVANFSIACNDDYKDQSGQEVKRTEWIRLVAFDKQAEIISQYMGKGSQIFVSAKQTTRKWNDNGVDRYITENKIKDFQMLGGRNGEQPAASQAESQQPVSQAGPEFPDDDQEIPF